MGVNLTKNHENGNWAIFLPAISSYYVQQMYKLLDDPDCYGKDRWPTGLADGAPALDFLKKDSYFYYKWGLYSAGHAKRNIELSEEREGMIQHRDRSDNIIIGDSGGYQIATGQIKMEWDNLQGNKWDNLRMEILRWLEHTSDWAMTLDVPAFAAVPPLSEKTGLTKFKDTLDISIENLDFFIRNRNLKSNTKFLNVLSGSTIENAREWYECAKHFSDSKFIKETYGDENLTLEGYAFAGINMRNMTVVLERMVNLIEDNLIENKDWIHFLGTSRLDWACFLTSLQRVIREHYNPNLTISFDCASPYLANAKGLIYSYNEFGYNRVQYTMEKAFDDYKYHNCDHAMPFGGPIMSNLTVGDLCIRDDQTQHPLYKEEKDIRVTPDANPDTPNPKTSWDGISYMLMMAHNTYNHIESVQEVNRLQDLELIRNPVSFSEWTREKKKSAATKLSPYIPSSTLFFNSFVNELFNPETVDKHKFIKDNKVFLDFISFGGTKTTVFENLFEE